MKRMMSWRDMGCLVAASAMTLAACSDSPSRSMLAPQDALLGFQPPVPRPGGTTVRSAEAERLEVCKDYAAGSQAPALTNFTVVVSGGTTAGFTFQLAAGACAEIWVNGSSTADNVSVTETVPAGFTAAWVTTTVLPTGGSSGSGGVASAAIGGATLTGALIVFTNTPITPPPPPPNLQGRMTGGGAQIYGGVRITRGFTIHCDIVLSNNLEINWEGNRWHIDKPLTAATCIDDPAYTEQPPVAPFNTFIGEGIGRLNGVDGSKVYFTFIDAGEPGKNDKASIKIVAPDGVTVVLDIPLVLLDNGNIQAHYDQPHGQHKP